MELELENNKELATSPTWNQAAPAGKFRPAADWKVCPDATSWTPDRSRRTLPPTGKKSNIGSINAIYRPVDTLLSTIFCNVQASWRSVDAQLPPGGLCTAPGRVYQRHLPARVEIQSQFEDFLEFSGAARGLVSTSAIYRPVRKLNRTFEDFSTKSDFLKGFSKIFEDCLNI